MPTPRRFPGAIPASSISSRTLAATPSKNASGERESSDRQRAARHDLSRAVKHAVSRLGPAHVNADHILFHAAAPPCCQVHSFVSIYSFVCNFIVAISPRNVNYISVQNLITFHS